MTVMAGKRRLRLIGFETRGYQINLNSECWNWNFERGYVYILSQ